MAALPRPVEVLHEGRWLAASLVAARRDRERGWRGLVQYTVGDVRLETLPSRTLLGLPARARAPLAYYGWRPASDLRPVSSRG